MIGRGHILETLKILDKKYNSAVGVKEPLLYSKLAIIELCGWIEESMDDIVIRCARRHLKNNDNIKYVKNEIVKRTYGFQYELHFRRMLIQLLGIINVERIEKNIDINKREEFKTTLNTLKDPRNSGAHPHVKGILRHIDTPSVTLGHFVSPYEGLIEFDAILKKQNLRSVGRKEN